MRSFIALALSISVCLFLVACGDDEENGSAAEPPPEVSDAGPIHVHGLGVNPADGALFVATHTGLFRAPPGKMRARRVADRFQDTMGFTVTGPNRFLGSGHPDGREGLPPFLGLIRSTDAGRTWQPVSLLGERDFHVLEAAGPRVYGYGSDFESRQASLLVSDDGGRTWEERTPPEPLLSLAIDPRDPERLVASGEDSLHASTDAGRGWRPLGGTPGMLAWPEPDELFLVRFDGSVARSTDAGRTWRSVGAVDGQPAAFESAAGELYVALHDGTVLRSRDGGRTWHVRSRP
jgi:BNR/Asp-box repeat